MVTLNITEYCLTDLTVIRVCESQAVLPSLLSSWPPGTSLLRNVTSGEERGESSVFEDRTIRALY